MNGIEPIFLALYSIYPLDDFPVNETRVARYTPGRIFIREALVSDDTITPYKCLAGEGPGAGNLVYRTPTLTRLTWVEPDGTEHEFKDTLNGGNPITPPTQPQYYNCQYDPTGQTAPIGPSRGTVFISDDATAATFIADNPIYDAASIFSHNIQYASGVAGWLLFKDGTRYRTDASGSVVQIVDRNGNQTNLSIGTGGLTVFDSLGRTTTITYASGLAPGSDTIQYPGAGGTPHVITVNYDYLANHLRSGMTTQDMTTLFPATNSTGTHNPVMVSSVVLPDQSSYTIQYNAYGEVARVTLPGGGAYEYDYPATTPFCSGNASGCVVDYNVNGNELDNRLVYRRVTARRVYSNGGTLEGQTCYAPAYGDSTTVQVTYTASSSCTSGVISSYPSDQPHP
jgi:hypothetical protein